MSFNTENTDGLSEVSIGPRLGVTAGKLDPQDTQHLTSTKTVKTSAQIDQIKSSLNRIFLFKDLNNKDLDELIDFMFLKNVKANEVVIREDEPGDNFYVIENGMYDVFKKNKLLRKYKNSGYFGELALLFNTPRNATVIATTDGTLWGLERSSFQRNVLQRAFENRQKSINLIGIIEIFKSLPSEASMTVADQMKFLSSNNEILFQEGEKNERVYFIENGTVQIIKSIEGKEVIKKVLTRGEYFGEESILFNRASSFTAKTSENTNLGFIPSETFKLNTIYMEKILEKNFESLIKSIN